MSLKAKIEAVIYASEEPVTLAQLASLLSHEAQAELDHLESAQQQLALELHSQSPEAQPGEPAQPASDDIDAEDVLAMAGASETVALISEEPLALASEAPESAPEPAAETLAPEKDEKQLQRDEKDRARRLREYFRSILDDLIADYAQPSRGLEIREVASGFRLATKPEYHDAVRGFVKSLKPPLKLSLQALETLAVVAYKQPVTAPEISEIRGVDSGGVLGSLMTRKLITTAGRKQVIGRPILYKTTRDFLLRFGLKDVSELPSIEEFEKLAGSLADTESQEEIPMPVPNHQSPESAADLQAERGANAPQADGDSTPLSPTPDGNAVPSASERLTGTPPASVVPGVDDDPTESPELEHQIDRDQAEREFPAVGSIPSLEPK